MIYTYQRLREECLASSTRPFLARGASVKRCQRCLLAEAACICPWRLEMAIGIDIVLLMHRDEVFKPTNSGRLIADVFPANTFVFPWSRTQPPEELISLLCEPERYPVILFPPGQGYLGHVHVGPPKLTAQQRLTLILLDGTWKQARKMFKTSRWLHKLPLVVLDREWHGRYAVRQAAAVGQLATAEAVAEFLQDCHEPSAAQLLSDYFDVFNLHYLSTRSNIAPSKTCHHQRIEHLQSISG